MRVVHYIRVSTEDQAEHGFSVSGQTEELREHSLKAGHEVAGVILDRGEKRWNLDRPGLNEIRELVSTTQIDEIWAWAWDRYGESPWSEVLALEMEGYGVKLRALDDGGEGEAAEILRGMKGIFSAQDQRKRVERSRMGKRSRARRGEVIPSGQNLPYGFQYNESRTNYEVYEKQMAVVRQLFEMVGKRGESLKSVCRTLDAEGVPTPGRSSYWNPITVRRFLLDDRYKPHTVDELRDLGVATDVLDRLDQDGYYGVTYFGQTRATKRHQIRKNASNKPREIREDRIPIPIPHFGIPREWVDATRKYFETYRGWRDKPGRRFYELRGFIYCGECGRKMTSYQNSSRRYHYYQCQARRNHGRRACPDSFNLNAGRAEKKIARDVSHLLQDSDRVMADLDAAIKRETAHITNTHMEVTTWLKIIEDCHRKRSGYQDLAADGLMTREELAEKLRVLDKNKADAQRQVENARDGQAHIEELKETKKAMLSAYASGILYDGVEHFSPEMRHEIYAALGLKVTVNSDGTMNLEYHVDADVIRLTREVEEYAREVAEFREKLITHTKRPGEEPLRAWSS